MEWYGNRETHSSNKDHNEKIGKILQLWKTYLIRWSYGSWCFKGEMVPRENVFQAQVQKASGRRVSSGGNWKRQQGWDLVSNGEAIMRDGWSGKLDGRSYKSP